MSTMSTFKMETDPDGLSQQVAVIMTGKVYRDAGLKHSKHPEVEGLLYDKLCQIGKHRLRDDVRRMAHNIAISVRDKEFQPTVAWLDNFMRRFCLSKKKMGFHSVAMLKTKPSPKPSPAATAEEKGVTQEEVFSALGFPKDFTGFGEDQNTENGSSTTEATDGKTNAENGVNADASKRENGVDGDSGAEGSSNDETKAQKETEGISECGENSLSESKSNGKNDSEAQEVEPLEEEDPLAIEEAMETEEPANGKGTLEELEKNEDAKDQNKDLLEEPEKDKKKVSFEEPGKDGDTNDKKKCSSEEHEEGQDKKGSVVVKKKQNNEESSHKEEEDADDVDLDPENESSNEEETEADEDESTSNGSEEDEIDLSGSGDDDKKRDDKYKLTEEEEKERKRSKQEVEEDCIGYAKEENKYYKKNIEALQKRLEANVVRCTSCFEQVNHQLRNLVYTHPVLGIFICKRCRKYYGKGKFCKDEDGYDEYCRLCAEGGDLLCCEQKDCFNGFCKRCIKRVIGRTELRHAERAKKWACYVCDKTPLIELRALHRAILNNLKEDEEKNSNLSRKQVREKEIKSKFALLKRNRLEKAQKMSPEKPGTSPKKNSATKAAPWLKEIIDNLKDMLQVCHTNVEKIDGMWMKHSDSGELTEKTGRRILRQLEVMQNNFGLMKEDVSNELEKGNSETPAKEKEDGSSKDKSQEGKKSTQEGEKSGDCSQETQSDITTNGKSGKSKQRGDKGDKLKEKKGEEKAMDKGKGDTLRKSDDSASSEGETNDQGMDHVEEEVEEEDKGDEAKEKKNDKTEDKGKGNKATKSDKGKDASDVKDNEKDKGKGDKATKSDEGKDASDVEDSEAENDDSKKVKRGKSKKSDGNEKGKDAESTRKSRRLINKNDDEKDADEGQSDVVKEDSEENRESETKKSGRPRKSTSDSVTADAEKDDDKQKKVRSKAKKNSVCDEDSQGPEDETISDSKDDDDDSDGHIPDDSNSMEVDGDSQNSSKAPLATSADATEVNKKDLPPGTDQMTLEDDDAEAEGESSEGKGSRRRSKRNMVKISDEEKKAAKIGSKETETGKDEEEPEDASQSDKENEKSKRKSTGDDDDRDNNKSTSKASPESKSKGSKTKKTEGEEEEKKTPRKLSLGKGRGSKNKEEQGSDEEEEEETDKKDVKVMNIKKEDVKNENIKKDVKNENLKKDIKKEDGKSAKKESDSDEKEGSSESEEKGKKSKKDDADDGKKKTKKKMEDDKKRKRKDTSDEEGKKPSTKRKKKTALDDDSDDGLLGIGTSSSNSGESAEEDTDEEIKRRLKDHAKKVKKGKVKLDSDEDSEVERAKKRKKKESPKKGSKQNPMNKKNKDALSSLLASDSSEDREDEDEGQSKKGKKKLGKNKSKKDDDSKTHVSESSDSESAGERTPKKGKKDKKKKVKTDDNEKAKDALLESESDFELEDKPKPKCKKKNYKEPREPGVGRKHRLRAQRKKLSEEEKEELKKNQLKSKAHVTVKKLSPTILEALEGEEGIDISEHSELSKLIEQDQATYDGDAEEEDSDQEFSKLMKFNVNTKFCKPGPKSKKKFLLSDNDSGEDDKEGDNDDDDENGDGAKEKKGSRKKKEGLLDIDIDEDQNQDEEDEDEELFSKKKRKDGGITLNEKLKKNLLLSSDEDEDDEEEEEEEKAVDDEEEKEKKKHDLRKKKKKNNSDGEDAPKVSKKGYMNLDIISDDEDDDKKDDDDDDDDDEDDDDDNDSDFEESPRKRRTFELSSDSDSDGKKKKKKRRKDESSDYDSETDDEEDEPKSKRKRIKKVTSSSDEEGGDKDKDESPSKHKKIRRVIRDEDLLETTKTATQEEEERRKRIAERQKRFNAIFEIDVESDQKDLGRMVLDFDPDTKKELVKVNEKLTKFLKPHQAQGIKFMWDATIESIEMLSKKEGSGCILAHCMGLGKTLQVITYIHTLMTNRNTNQLVQHVMVCCPVNTVYNWVAEFQNWLKGKLLPFEVCELVSAKDLWGRAYRLDDWWREGGVCIMGYDMYRNLSNTKNKRYKAKMKEIFQKTLVDPGPDVMVCDEGHILKNEKTALAIAINKVKTKRRIVLTGTPLQNNLKEYHCMIQFVKPNLLGTKKEFMNRFVNPIEQGQCAEADQRDVKRMKRRAHILHNLLEGCVQRFDYTVLKPFLPPKFEYVISIQLSDIQVKLYQYYLDNLAQGGPKRHGSGLFVDYGALSRVWTHPKVLELAQRRVELQGGNDEDEEMDDFICDDSTTEESSEDERSKKKKAKKKGNDEEEDEVIEEEEVDKDEAEEPGPIPGLTASGKVRVDWWRKVLADNFGDDFDEEDFLDKMEHSGKLILLLDILRESCSIGDKVLVFSQSLLALDMIEDFLSFVDAGEVELPEPEDPLPMPFKRWKKERDYLRLDGSVNADIRKQQCKTFNNMSNERCRLFLISTRAGGLGINLVAANRVIIFDSSWNPSHDSQSIFRVYRFGQKKPCYVYRFVAQGTMEEKIYSRQVTKMSTALRVVDEHQIKRYFKMADLQQLYEFTPADKDTRETPAVPEDRLLAELLQRQKQWIVNYHEHDSLLENQTSEELSEEERKAAWEDFENEKKGFFVQNQRNSVMPVVGNMGMPTQSGLPSLSLASFSFEGVVNTIKSQNPHLSQNDLCESVVLATKQIQRIHLNHYQRVQGMVYNLKNPMIAPEQRKLLPFGNHPEMLPMLEQQLRMLEDNIQRENQVINHMTSITPQKKDNYASMMSAGLLRGQPTGSDTTASSAEFVGRSVAATSTATATTSGSSSQQQQNPPAKKKDGSGDVIMLD